MPEIERISCCLSDDEYTATRVKYEDGSIGVDCDGFHDDCVYKAEVQIWNERGLEDSAPSDDA